MGGYFLIAVLLFGCPLLLAGWLVARTISTRNRLDEMGRRFERLERELFQLKGRPGSQKTTEQGSQEADITSSNLPPPHVAPTHVPPQPPEIQVMPNIPVFEQQAGLASEISVPPTIEPELPAAAATPSFNPAPSFSPAINWEQFMGVKLFAWIGGLALFLGVAFFVKYSFDNNLVPPELRVAIGFIAGLALLVGGVVLSRKDYKVLAHTLCATGVVVLYAVTFSCRSIYHFEFFGPVPTFLLMVLITTTAFLLSVRLNALAVAILGMLGGFLTPPLLSTGQDNPFGLFGYILILDVGLIFVSLNRRWTFLNALAAGCTIVMQVGWAEKFFVEKRYFLGDKILIPLGVLACFAALYLSATWWAKRRDQIDWWLSGAALGLSAAAIGFTAWFLSFPALAERPWLMFGFLFLIDLVVTAIVLLEERATISQSIAGLAVFGVLAAWTGNSLTPGLLYAALAFYFVFAVLHAGFPLALQHLRRRPIPNNWAGNIFPSLALLLVLIPVFKLAEVSLAVWPFIFMVDILAIGLAVLTASLLPVLVVLVLTMAAAGALIFKIPPTLDGLPVPLVALGGFAVFFMVAGIWMARKFKPQGADANAQTEDFSLPANVAKHLPAVSGVLPFLLLIMVTERLPLANPSPVFGLALLLVVLLLGVTKLFSVEWLPAIALACLAGLECNWHFNRFDATQPTVPLTWYLIFLAVFTVFPFLFMRQFAEKKGPWAAAAMAGLPQFLLVHRLVRAAYPNDVMGLLPAVFAVPPLIGLVVVLRRFPAQNPARMSQLALFGAAALFFITLIFPVQFDRQWITIGWALEGAALLWLFHRVPHDGLRIAGMGLLAVAFARLALNPAVLDYHQRSARPILNWYLYSYGISAACLFMGARLAAPPRNRLCGINAPPILIALGTILTFYLLNIEIADFFSPPGSTLAFQFEGNFARDMTYSIAWALFALALLVIGIIRQVPASRYSGLGLLSVTLLKLFFHDLAQLGQLYRIGAFIGVAAVAMVASFAYQRFYAAAVKEKEKQPPLETVVP